MNVNRGRIANLGFEGQRVRGVYFFAGNWRFAPPGQEVPEFYEFPVTEYASLYTIHPKDARHLGWSESVANQEFALDAMVDRAPTPSLCRTGDNVAPTVGRCGRRSKRLLMRTMSCSRLPPHDRF